MQQLADRGLGTWLVERPDPRHRDAGIRPQTRQRHRMLRSSAVGRRVGPTDILVPLVSGLVGIRCGLTRRRVGRVRRIGGIGLARLAGVARITGCRRRPIGRLWGLWGVWGSWGLGGLR